MAQLDYHTNRTTPAAVTPLLTYAASGKRCLDLAMCMVLLPLALPLIALAWAMARLDGHAGFFCHERIGRDGRVFRCWKVRTMVADADLQLESYLAENPIAADQWARTQKLDSDPRITRMGRFLRRTSLDELPQIWNVLRGEMSLVGPRPITRAELSRYGNMTQAYLSLRPGITGLWQVLGRSNGCYRQRITLDGEYARDMTVMLDLILLVRTVFVVLWPTGK